MKAPMTLIPYTSFFIYSALNDPWKIQEPLISGMMLAALLIQTYNKKLAVPFAAIPYLILPIWLFATINQKLEHSSNDALLCFSLLAATLLIFSQKEIYDKWLFRSITICASMHLAVQAFGVAAGDSLLAIRSIFPLANEIMLFYMLAIFAAILVHFKDSNPTWKRYAKITGILALVSIVLGDPAAYGTTKTLSTFKISREDAVGIWLGLACGALFTLSLFLWKKFNLPKTLAVCITTVILLTMMFIGIIAVNSSFFSPGAIEEAASRLVNWQAAWNLIKENPLGVGFGAYGANIMQQWPTLKEAYFVWPGIVFTSAHNQYIQILTEIGWPGLIYYSALFAVPWLIAVFRWLETGERRFLFIAGALAAVLSVMEVAEAMSLYGFSQIIHWGFLLFCVKALQPAFPRAWQKHLNLRFVNLRFVHIILLVPLIAFMLFDRGKQLYSLAVTYSTSPSIESHEKTVDKALAIYPKNSKALWRKGLIYVLRGDYAEALKCFDSVEEMSGHLLQVNQIRADIYLGGMENPKSN
jgi:O-antigen ligase